MISERFASSVATILLLCSNTSPGPLAVDGFSLPCPQVSTSLRQANQPSPVFPLQMISAGASQQDEQESTQQSPNDKNNGDYDDSVRRGLRRLAQLSLEDYEWRMSLFKEKEADRKMEESLAIMMGGEADYVRPMDAGESKIGPLVS